MTTRNRNTLVAILLALTFTACHKERRYDAQGTFEATVTTVSSEGQGKLVWLDVEEGSLVEAGRQVGLVDTVQLALQRREAVSQRHATVSQKPDVTAQAAALRERIKGAVTERDRLQRLYNEGAATRQQLDQANTQVDVLRGELEGLMSQLDVTTRSVDSQETAANASIDRIEDLIARCAVYSPVTGTVLAKYVEPGELVGFGTPLFQVADLSHMTLRAYFTSAQLAKLKIGEKVDVTADFGGGETVTLPGTVTWISSRSEFTPKMIQTSDSRANLVYAVKIAVDNPDGRLKIGLAGDVSLKDEVRD